MTAATKISEALHHMRGMPVFLAGSVVAEDTYGLSYDAHDVDLFCPTSQVLVSAVQSLLDKGFKIDDRFERVWVRWLRYGFKSWHTNSMRLTSPGGIEYNLVYKLTEGHAATSLAEVLESFDFGLLGTGYECEDGTFRDMRPYLFPDVTYWETGPLPMMPNKRANWRAGFISQYNGLREAGRYAKYHGYGFDLSAVKDDLVMGYWSASSYFATRFEPEKQQLGKIYETIAEHIDNDRIAELTKASSLINYNDSLDAIMEALE